MAILPFGSLLSLSSSAVAVPLCSPDVRKVLREAIDFPSACMSAGPSKEFLKPSYKRLQEPMESPCSFAFLLEFFPHIALGFFRLRPCSTLHFCICRSQAIVWPFSPCQTVGTRKKEEFGAQITAGAPPERTLQHELYRRRTAAEAEVAGYSVGCGKKLSCAIQNRCSPGTTRTPGGVRAALNPAM